MDSCKHAHIQAWRLKARVNNDPLCLGQTVTHPMLTQVDTSLRKFSPSLHALPLPHCLHAEKTA